MSDLAGGRPRWGGVGVGVGVGVGAGVALIDYGF